MWHRSWESWIGCRFHIVSSSKQGSWFRGHYKVKAYRILKTWSSHTHLAEMEWGQLMTPRASKNQPHCRSTWHMEIGLSACMDLRFGTVYRRMYDSPLRLTHFRLLPRPICLDFITADDRSNFLLQPLQTVLLQCIQVMFLNTVKHTTMKYYVHEKN